MEPAIPRYDANALEARRQRAIEMLKDGKKKARVADELNVSRAAVTVWWHKYANNGDRGIARKARPGRPPKVQRDKIATLPILLKKGAVAYGYSTDLWTTKRVAELIRKEFVVSYDRDFVSRILNQLGLSWQRPERKAIERDEIAIKRRIQYRWPEKKASKLHATIVFADESGFSLVPFVAKTWAIRGRTPIIRHPFRWPKISSISAATTRNQLLFLVVDGTINAVVCQRFPIHLLRHVEVQLS